MVIPPVVYCAGLLRASGNTVQTNAWAWIGEQTGQRLFDPPNVAGWDYTHWLDTSRWTARFTAVNYALENGHDRPRVQDLSTSTRTRRRRWPARWPSGAIPTSPTPPGASCAPSAAGRRSGSRPTGRSAPTGSCARTPCARSSPPRPIGRPADGPPSARRQLLRRLHPDRGDACGDRGGAPGWAGWSPREWDPRMPIPAGTGIDRRRFLLAATGGLVSVYGAGRLGLGGQALLRGSRRRPTARARRARYSSRSSSPVGSTPCRCSRPPRTRPTASCARRWPCPRPRGSRSPRTHG